MQGVCALVRGCSRASNLLSFADLAMCVEFFNLGSGWFDCIKPLLSTSLEDEQGGQGAGALVRG